MKAEISLPLFGSILGVIVIFSIPSFAWSTYTNTTTRTNQSARETGATTDGITTTERNGGSWKQSASEAVHNAELVAGNAYNHAAHDVEDLSLKARVEAALHENQSTRGSDVHVTADNGIVTLSGQVPSERSARGVEEVVANVYGVKAVNNDLSYPRNQGVVTPPDADSTVVAHPAYSDIAPAERVPTY
jgi:BON domain